MHPVAIFVLSDVRSGSTLLDLCLGAHPRIVSLGELHWLRAYATEDRSIYDPAHPLVCSCGARVVDCPFWISIAAHVGRPLESLTVRSGLRHPQGMRATESQMSHALRVLLRILPGLARSRMLRKRAGTDALARDLTAVFDAVASSTGCDFCVDSSKSTVRFRAIYDRDPARARAVILTRDYRAVVHSRMKRGQSLKAAALGWKRKMRDIEVLTSDLPPAAVHKLAYESLCENPRSELQRLCDFLGIEFSDKMLTRPTDAHHIGGSPSKFSASHAAIVLDRSHENRFSQAELAFLRKQLGVTARKWGY